MTRAAASLAESGRSSTGNSNKAEEDCEVVSCHRGVTLTLTPCVYGRVCELLLQNNLIHQSACRLTAVIAHNQQAENDKGQQKVAARREQGGLPDALTAALLVA